MDCDEEIHGAHGTSDADMQIMEMAGEDSEDVEL